MPKYYIPSKIAQHRVAVIALYRALLARCSSAPLPIKDQTSLRNAIRNKFRQNRKIQSPFQLGLTFRAGYETLDHLDALKAGNTASAGYLSSLIATLPRRTISPLPIWRRPPPETPPPRNPQACLPDDKKVLNVRPRVQLPPGKKRRVPILSATGGIPFLRLTRPQPPSLSRMLRQKLARREDLFLRRVEFKYYWTPIAKQEDEWDALLRDECRFHDERGEGSWMQAVNDTIEVTWESMSREYEQAREKGRQMLEIVDRETELALQEGQTVFRGRRRRPLWVLKPEKKTKKKNGNKAKA